jgi:hypothetical protein
MRMVEFKSRCGNALILDVWECRGESINKRSIGNQSGKEIGEVLRGFKRFVVHSILNDWPGA